eukprot:766191-Hanusia_phi.AAC.1
MRRLLLFLAIIFFSNVSCHTSSNEVCNDEGPPLILIHSPSAADQTNAVEFNFQFIRVPPKVLLNLKLKSLTSGGYLGTHEQFVSSDRFSLMSFLEPDVWRCLSVCLLELCPCARCLSLREHRLGLPGNVHNEFDDD